MRPCNKEFRIIKAPAGKTWKAMQEQHIYSCPDTPGYDYVVGATCLLLTNGRNERLFFDVEAVELCNLRISDFLESVPVKFHHRLSNYTRAVGDIRGILDLKCNYRFYFLSDDPCLDWLQDLVAGASEPKWEECLSLRKAPSGAYNWPKQGKLLWPGCTRGDENQLHRYPLELKQRLARLGLQPDERNNGPAIMSFLAAGGCRPISGREGWPIHHIYDGKGEGTRGPKDVLHAASNGQHFTHSAGLVAARPEAHKLAHRSDLLRWLLRREAFLRFGYDPMSAFSQQ
jgi:hypothetical protein